MALDRLLSKIRQNAAKTEVTIIRQILWTSKNGKWVVVRGPFPQGFQRTTTRKTIEAATRVTTTGVEHGLQSRQAVTSDSYAKTLAKLVVNSQNDWGEVCP